MREGEIFGWWPAFVRWVTRHDIKNGRAPLWKYAIHKVTFECPKCMAGWVCIAYLIGHSTGNFWDIILFIGLGIFTAERLETL